MANIRRDKTAFSAVAACECGWRFLGATNAEVGRAIARHVERVHPDPAELKRRRLIAQRATFRESMPSGNTSLYGIPRVGAPGRVTPDAARHPDAGTAGG